MGYTPGQVEGGRWKPLQYYMRRFIFRNHLIAASSDGRILVKSDDAFAPFSGTATVSLLHVDTGVVAPLATYPVALPLGGGATAWACANATVDIARSTCPSWASLLPSAGCAADGSDCVVLLSLTDATGALAADNFELLTPPYNMALPGATVTFAIGAPAADGSVPITLTTDKTALFVVLTTLAQGRFSDNAIHILPGATVVDFIPWGPLDAGLLKSSLRVEHIAQYPMNATKGL